MKLKWTSRIIHLIGITAIISFAAINIYVSTHQREFINDSIPYIPDFLKYVLKQTIQYEDKFYDIRMKQTLDPDEVDKRIVLVQLDDRSIFELGGQWPIPRTHWATLLDKLKSFGAKVVGFDVFFSEDSLSCPGTQSADDIFGQAISNFQKNGDQHVVLPYKIQENKFSKYESDYMVTIINHLKDLKTRHQQLEAGLGDPETLSQLKPEEIKELKEELKGLPKLIEDHRERITKFYKEDPNYYAEIASVTNDYSKEIPDVLLFSSLTSTSKNISLQTQYIDKKIFPIEQLIESEASLGYIGAHEDTDGVFRQYEVMAHIDGVTTFLTYSGLIEKVAQGHDIDFDSLEIYDSSIFVPSFSTQIYKLYTNDPKLEIMASDTENKFKFQHGEVLLNLRGETKIRWLGGRDNFPKASLVDVVNAPLGDEKMTKLFNGKIVMVGSTAFAAHDFRHTPVDAQLPGVYFHMNMLHMLLQGKFFVEKDMSVKLSWQILAIAAFILLVVQLFGNALIDLILTLGLTAGLYYYDTYHLTPLGYEVKLLFSLFAIGATYSWTTFLNFYLANKDKAFLKSAFGNYISPELIDEMYQSGEPPKLGGDSGIRTAFFTDIQGFSTFSEKLSATQLVELLNEYLTAMTDILLEEKGTLDKYEGDAIIAFFGAPMPLPDHARRACMVSHKMQEKLLELRKKWLSEGDKWPQIVHDMRMRIGLNTGEIVTGNMGSSSRMNYTMMGDSVNLAARLEEAAKQYGIFTHVADFTVNEIDSDEFAFRELDTIRVVGKSEPVTTYDLLGVTAELPDNLAQLQTYFHEGLKLYKSQQWDQAIETFKKSLVFENLRFPGLEGKKTNPSLIYIERCEQFKENPPPENWDGVFTLTSK